MRGIELAQHSAGPLDVAWGTLTLAGVLCLPPPPAGLARTPPAHRGLMRRRLVQALDGAARHPLTLLAASTGWDKTSPVEAAARTAGGQVRPASA